MALRRKSSSFRGQGKQLSDSNELEGRRKAQFVCDLLSSRSMYERYKNYFFNRTTLPSRVIDFVQLSQVRFGEYFL